MAGKSVGRYDVTPAWPRKMTEDAAADDPITDHHDFVLETHASFSQTSSRSVAFGRHGRLGFPTSLKVVSLGLERPDLNEAEGPWPARAAAVAIHEGVALEGHCAGANMGPGHATAYTQDRD